MPWEVASRNGIYLPRIGWWMDARQPVARSFISHAHSDHVAAHDEVLCSEITSRLVGARFRPSGRETALPFEKPWPLSPGVSATLHPAGHIFGSAQLLLESADGRLLYTGDFKLRPGLSAEPCATPAADTLIMETTYGRPQYQFPPPAQVMADVVFFCRECLDQGEIPVLFGYSLGKSQEILQGLASAALPVMLHPETFRLTRVYEELGVSFPPYALFEPKRAAGHVVICPPQAPDSSWLRNVRPRRTAALTGWAVDPGTRFRSGCDAAFPLSDHADFNDLLRFVERVGASRVYTVHGFAREFAQELRSRGLEAWALGRDNQLEFSLSLPRPPAAPLPPPPAPAGPADAPPDAFARFAAAAEAIRATPKKSEKVDLLKAYLARLEAADAGRAALFFTGRPFPQSSGRSLGLGWSAIKRAVLAAAGADETAFRAAYNHHRDSGETVETLLAGKSPGEPLRLGGVASRMDAIAAERGPSAKAALLTDLFRRASPLEAKYAVKIITGDLRIGLKEGLVEEAVAAAFCRPLEAVRDAHLLCGNIAAVAAAARDDRLGAIELRLFHPLQFMLASPEPTAQGLLGRLGSPVWLEEKYDGIRCQIHRDAHRIELFSRDLRRITAQFPDVARAFQSLPHAFIADGELLAWREGRALPFADLQKRLGRAGDDFFLGEEVPVSLLLYDLLWIDGESLLKHPLAARRARLAALPLPAAAVLAPQFWAEDAVAVEAAFLRARERGNEGLMAKDPTGCYCPGRRGFSWLKLKKAYATLDVVVTGAEYGHGKRRNVLSDYTFAVRDRTTGALLNVGKAYSGLTDPEIARLTAHFLENTVELRGSYRRVQPDTVIEVAFDSIRPSRRHESGFALRFPRIVRVRTDKTPGEIDTLDTCRRLAGNGGPG